LACAEEEEESDEEESKADSPKAFASRPDSLTEPLERPARQMVGFRRVASRPCSERLSQLRAKPQAWSFEPKTELPLELELELEFEFSSELEEARVE